MSDPTPTPPPTVSPFHAEGFRDRVFIVTGGAHGIGLAVVEQLLSLDARVLVIDFDGGELNALRDKHADDDALICIEADITGDGVLEDAIEQITTTWGRLDGIVNNAMLNALAKIDDQPEADFIQTWKVNTLAAWRLIKLALPLLEVRGGSVVNISSIMAWHTQSSNAAYSSSKAALEGLTRQLAVELGPRFVRVNAILPGFINTARGINRDRTGADAEVVDKYIELTMRVREHRVNHLSAIPRHGQPADIAGPVVFLLSDAATFVTGTSLLVDGGTACIILPGKFTAEFHDAMAELQRFITAHPEVRSIRPTKPSPGIKYDGPADTK